MNQIQSLGQVSMLMKRVMTNIGDEESDGGQHVVQFDGDYVNDDDDCDSHRDNENHMNIVNETLNMVECKQDIASAPNPTLPRRPTLMLINESESVCID